MKDFIVAVIIVMILTIVITYIIKEKKKGTKCIGCPHAKTCGKKNCSS